jgi:hypothetical protein
MHNQNNQQDVNPAVVKAGRQAMEVHTHTHTHTQT